MVTGKPWKPDLWAQGSSREGAASGVLTGAEHPVCNNIITLCWVCCTGPRAQTAPLFQAGLRALPPFFPRSSPFSPHLPLPPSFFFIFNFFFDKVTLCPPGWPGAYSISQAGLKLTVSCHGWRPNAGWAATPSLAYQWEKTQVYHCGHKALCSQQTHVGPVWQKTLRGEGRGQHVW